MTSPITSSSTLLLHTFSFSHSISVFLMRSFINSLIYSVNYPVFRCLSQHLILSFLLSLIPSFVLTFFLPYFFFLSFIYSPSSFLWSLHSYSLFFTLFFLSFIHLFTHSLYFPLSICLTGTKGIIKLPLTVAMPNFFFSSDWLDSTLTLLCCISATSATSTTSTCILSSSQRISSEISSRAKKWSVDSALITTAKLAHRLLWRH